MQGLHEGSLCIVGLRVQGLAYWSFKKPRVFAVLIVVLWGR